MDFELQVEAASSPPPITPVAQHRKSRHSQAEPARISAACQICREKKVKCSGEHPCRYCTKRLLHCVFSKPNKKRLYSVSEIRDLEHKVAFYETQEREKSAQPTLQPNSTNSVQDEHPTSREAPIPPISHGPMHPPTSGRPTSHSASVSHTGSHGGKTYSDTPMWKPPNAMAPASALSSSETFGSEVKSLLVARSNPNSAKSPSTSGIFFSSQIDREALKSLRNWPTEEDAHSILETVVLNVGISQQLFDVRTFSDNLSLIYQETDAQVPRIWVCEVLLVFAIGRLLQAQMDDASELPDTAFFREAMKYLPALSDLRRQQILGIEVMGLAALYLQIVDRKDDAYIYSNTALRLGIGHGMHRANTHQKLRRSEIVHSNRLWWSIYMQERRLAAAGGHPVAISDVAITIGPPSDYAGFPAATAMNVNVKVARILGQITSTIYSQNKESESSFLSNVQNILHSLHELETTMPGEYFMDFRGSGLVIAGRPFAESPSRVARTSASLYLSIYLAVIYTARPVLLHMAKDSRDGESKIVDEASPVQRQLAGICVEAARKSLVILQQLREQGLIAKHAFIDLDSVFSVGFIFILVEAINPGKETSVNSIDGCRSILQYLETLGNHAAARRLAEIDSMCTHLSLPLRGSNPHALRMGMERSLQPDTDFDIGIQSLWPRQDGGVSAPAGAAALLAGRSINSDQDNTGSGPDQLFSNTDMANISLEGEDLYWMYHAQGFAFAGVDDANWEALDTQMNWNE